MHWACMFAYVHSHFLGHDFGPAAFDRACFTRDQWPNVQRPTSVAAGLVEGAGYDVLAVWSDGRVSDD